MLIDYGSLYYDIQKWNNIALYGCGYTAKSVRSIIAKTHINVSFCLLTELIGDEYFYGLPIYAVDEWLDTTVIDGIIICVISKEANNQIKTTLNNKDIKNYVSIFDYQICGKRMLYIYERMSKDKFNCILNRNIQLRFTKYSDRLFEDKYTSNGIEGIALVVFHLNPRVLKIANALKGKGYYIWCFVINNCPFNTNSFAELKMVSNIYEEFNDPFELLYRIKKINNLLFIYLLVWPYCKALAISSMFISMRNNIGCVVFEQYDAASLLPEVECHIIELEKYCVENAPIVIDRGYEVEYLTEKVGYTLSGYCIRIFDGCSCERDIIENSINQNVLTMVYAGGIVPTKLYPLLPWEKLVEVCANARCHLHIYPSDQSWKDFNINDEYLVFWKIQDRCEYFHIHPPISNKRLSEELSKYDYGLNIVSCFPDERIGEHKINKLEKKVYAQTNKLFDYLDAGIPIIGTVPEKMCNYLEKEGVLHRAYIETLDFDYLKNNRLYYKENIRVLRSKLSCDRLMDALLNYIKL